jgi:hypothetical protein
VSYRVTVVDLMLLGLVSVLDYVPFDRAEFECAERFDYSSLSCVR